MTTSMRELELSRQIEGLERLLGNLVESAGEVDELFTSGGQNPAEKRSGIPVFRFDGHRLSAEAEQALLGMHDRLNDVANAKED